METPEGRAASGYPCPACGQDRLARVIGGDYVRQIELECACCGWIWAVEPT